MQKKTGASAQDGRRRRPRRRRSGAKRGRAATAAAELEVEPIDLDEDEPTDTSPIAVSARKLGIRRLHPEQSQVIEAALAGRDVMMILPTGFGKSACYQIPSMILEKPVLVISPLKALLKDQESKLLERDLPVVRLDGGVRGRARKAAMEKIGEGGPVLVMTTPETLTSPDTSEVLDKTGVSLVAIDEAHCLSEWGHDFRPAYLRLGQRVRALGDPPVLALTATATPRVREAIVKTLHMRDPVVVASSPHRSNLAFEVLACEDGIRARAMLRLVKRLRRPGIVYCATRREVDMVYAWLQRFGIPSHRYHAGMTAKERTDQQERFMRRGHRTVMVATSAFGLGIDKPDIRYILHYQSPASLEQYVQEAGRGGRDGAKANCILLADPADRAIHEALLARSRLRPEQLYRMGSALAAWSDDDKSPSLEALALSAEVGPRVASALLAKIEEAGLIYEEDKEIRFSGPACDLEEQVRALAGQFETLRTQDGRRLDALATYVRTEKCRAEFLSDYFGEEFGDACGLCDICRGSPVRPESFFEPLNAPNQPRRKTAGRSRAGKKTRGGQRSKSKGRGRGRGRGRARSNGAAAADARADGRDGEPARQRSNGASDSRRQKAQTNGDAAAAPTRRRPRRKRRRRSSRPRTSPEAEP